MEIDKLEQNEEAITATKIVNVVSVTLMNRKRRHQRSTHGIQTFALFLKYAKLFLSKVDKFFHFRASWMEGFL